MDHGIVGATVVLYVDDVLIIATMGLSGQIKDQIKKRFRMHDRGSVSISLSMGIAHNRKHHTIDIYQHSFIRTMLAKFTIDESGRVATPLAMKLHKRKPADTARNLTI
jgi:hypothetical protein